MNADLQWILGIALGSSIVGACWILREIYIRAGGWHKYAIKERRAIGLPGTRTS